MEQHVEPTQEKTKTSTVMQTTTQRGTKLNQTDLYNDRTEKEDKPRVDKTTRLE